MQVPAEFEPEEMGTGELIVRIDGRRYEAVVEDEQLYVRGMMNKGRMFPTPRPELYVIRVDASAKCALPLEQIVQFSAPPAADVQP